MPEMVPAMSLLNFTPNSTEAAAGNGRRCCIADVLSGNSSRGGREERVRNSFDRLLRESDGISVDLDRAEVEVVARGNRQHRLQTGSAESRGDCEAHYARGGIPRQ